MMPKDRPVKEEYEGPVPTQRANDSLDTVGLSASFAARVWLKLIHLSVVQDGGEPQALSTHRMFGFSDFPTSRSHNLGYMSLLR
jgi:hypothetical protein